MRAIAFDATPLTAAPQNFGGHAVRGIGRYTRSVMRSLATEQPDWAACHLLPVRTADTDLGWWPGDTLGTRRVRTRSQDTAWWTAPLLDSLAGRRHTIDAWHTTDPHAPLRPRSGGRSIVTAYDLIPLIDARVMATMRSHRRFVYRLYLQRLQRADLVVAISHTTAAEIHSRLRVPHERIAVVYPALHHIPEDGGEVPTGVEATHAQPAQLLFVGVAQPHKNAPQAVNALAALRRRGHDLRLRFVGPQPARARMRLAQHAALMAVADHVDWLDVVDDRRLRALYRSSTLLALSSVEGLGLTPLEALASGGRALCGPAGAFREALGDAGTYVDPDDSESVADAYEQLAGRPPAGLPPEALQRFSAAASARASIEAYERILG